MVGNGTKMMGDAPNQCSPFSSSNVLPPDVLCGMNYVPIFWIHHFFWNFLESNDFFFKLNLGIGRKII